MGIYGKIRRFCFFGFWDFVEQFGAQNGILEAQEVFKNLPGARGFVFPEYGLQYSYGDPDRARKHVCENAKHV